MHNAEFYERQRLRAYTYNGEVQVGVDFGRGRAELRLTSHRVTCRW